MNNKAKIIECSSKGDKRFSSLYAKMPDGFSIEHHYQVNIKGYNTISDSKNKIGKLFDFKTQLRKYKALWLEYLRVNPEFFRYLIQKRKEGYDFNDSFAKPVRRIKLQF